MNAKPRLLYLGLLIVLFLAACGQQATTAPPVTDAGSSSSGVPASGVVTVNLAGPQVGTTMRWADDSILLYVPGGTFNMGGNTLDNLQHPVTLTSFWIYRSEVTNREYALCVHAGICQAPQNPEALKAFNDSGFADHPVTGVNWNQAQAYCGWVRGSLPTEAQWEFTARGPDSNLYPWGSAEPSCDLANFKGCTGKTSTISDHPDGASPFAAFDMAGNVFEWVGDWYDSTYYSSAPPQDPPGPDLGGTRVVRSGSYLSNAGDLLPSQRFQLAPDKNRPDLGFRCVVKNISYIAPSCQTPLVYAPGVSTGGSAGGDCPAPQVSPQLNGCVSNRGFGRAPVTGPFVLSGAPVNCSQDGGSILCTSPDQSEHTYTVQVCGSCAVPAGETPPDTTCMDGYTSTGEACDIAPGTCQDGYQPASDGLCLPDAYVDCMSSVGSGPFSGWEAIGCGSPFSADDAVCQSGYVLVNTSGFQGCVRPDEIPADACPEGTYYDIGVGGCARPFGTSGGACPSGYSPYMDGACIPNDCADALGSGGSCFGFGCLEAALCMAAASENPTCQAGYAFVTDVGCVPASSTGTAGGSSSASSGTTPTAEDLSNPCLAGSTYDAAHNCCQADNPTCPEGSALSGATCVVPGAVSGGAPGSCTTVSIYTRACGSGPGGNPCVGLDYDACKAASGQGCTWNGTSCH